MKLSIYHNIVEKYSSEYMHNEIYTCLSHLIFRLMGEQRKQETQGGLWAPCRLYSTKYVFKQNNYRVQKATFIIYVKYTYYNLSLYFRILIQWFHKRLHLQDYSISCSRKFFNDFENSYSVITGSIPRFKILFQMTTPWKRKADLPNSVFTGGTW